MDLAASRFTSRAVSVLGFVAQLVPPPSNIKRIELAAGLKALGFLPNSLSTGAIYSLDKWGGPKIARPSAYCQSCMLMAAKKTLKGFDDQHHALARASLEGIPIAAALRGNTIPEGWTGEAFCTFLYRAAAGFVSGASQAQLVSISSVLNDLSVRPGASRNCLTSPAALHSDGLTSPLVPMGEVRQFRSGLNKGGLQSKRGSTQCKFYRAIRSAEADEWRQLLCRRAEALQDDELSGSDLNGEDIVPWPFHPYPNWEPSDEWVQEFTQARDRLPSKILYTVIKTWVNSWCTTSRLHENTQWPCIFGCCDEDDSLSHYLRCPRLWSSIGAVVKSELVFLDPVEKMGLVHPTSRKLKLIAVASRVYHALKFDFHDTISEAIESEIFDRVYLVLTDLVQHYVSEFGIT